MRFPVRVSTLLALVPVLVLLFGAASARAAGYGESESNDTTATADGPLLTGDSWSGAMQTENDQDYFVLYASQKTQLHLTLWNTTPSSDDYDYCLDMSLDDESGNYTDADDAEACQGENDSIDYTVNRGRYYVAIADEEDDVGGTYRIDASSAPALSATDPTLVVTPPPTGGGNPPPVSSGHKPARCVDPHVNGLTLRAAKRRLAAHHCGLGTVHRRHTRRRQYVYDQSGAPGERYRHGHRINLWLRPHHRHHH